MYAQYHFFLIFALYKKMASEITFGYRTGKTLTYAVYNPDGTVVTAAGTSLPEITGTGYYVADNTSILENDFVIVRDGTTEVAYGEYKPDAQKILNVYEEF